MDMRVCPFSNTLKPRARAIEDSLRPAALGIAQDATRRARKATQARKRPLRDGLDASRPSPKVRSWLGELATHAATHAGQSQEELAHARVRTAADPVQKAAPQAPASRRQPVHRSRRGEVQVLLLCPAVCTADRWADRLLGLRIRRVRAQQRHHAVRRQGLRPGLPPALLGRAALRSAGGRVALP